MKIQANENESMRKRILVASQLVLAVLCLVLAAVSAWPQSQTPVPTTAREAAKTPEFAARLAAARAANKSQATAPSKSTPASPLDDSVPYDNGHYAGTTTFYFDGEIDGNDNAFFITGPNYPNIAGSFQDISNGFVSAASGTPNQLEFGEWIASGLTPSSISYELGTTAFGTDLGSGSVAQTICPGAGCNSTFLFTNSFGYDIYDVTIPVTSAAMTAGNEYWLSLSNASDSQGNNSTEGWDIPNGGSGGPATCNFRQSGTNYGSCGLGGESFTLSATGTTYTYTPKGSPGFCTFTISGSPYGFGVYNLSNGTCSGILGKTWTNASANIMVGVSSNQPPVWFIATDVEGGYSFIGKTTATVGPAIAVRQMYDIVYKQNPGTARIPWKWTTSPGSWTVTTSAASASKGRQPGRSAPAR
ncbi:MAG: hypothetical protein ACHP8B_01805 [Terriglobales bacterium]